MVFSSFALIPIIPGNKNNIINISRQVLSPLASICSLSIFLVVNLALAAVYSKIDTYIHILHSYKTHIKHYILPSMCKYRHLNVNTIHLRVKKY